MKWNITLIRGEHTYYSIAHGDTKDDAIANAAGRARRVYGSDVWTAEPISDPNTGTGPR